MKSQKRIEEKDLRPKPVEKPLQHLNLLWLNLALFQPKPLSPR